jgi:hypothetical protein
VHSDHSGRFELHTKPFLLFIVRLTSAMFRQFYCQPTQIIKLFILLKFSLTSILILYKFVSNIQCLLTLNKCIEGRANVTC